MPGICKTALAGIAELKKDHGIDCTPDEIVRLHERGLRQENPRRLERLALLGCPVEVGGAVLFRLTIRADIWWRELAAEWFAGQDTWLTASLAYAMAHGRDRNPAAFPLDRDTAFDRVQSWYRSLPVSIRELDAAIAQVFRDSDADRMQEILDTSIRLLDLTGNALPALQPALAPILDAPRPERWQSPDWEQKAQELAAMTGVAPDYWMAESREFVLRSWIAASRVSVLQAGGHLPDDAQTDLDDAIRAFRAEIVAIIQTRAKPDGESPAEAQRRGDSEPIPSSPKPEPVPLCASAPPRENPT